MVAAVFHNPLPEVAAVSAPTKRTAPSASASNSVALSAASMPATTSKEQVNMTSKMPFDWRDLWLKVVPPILGMALLVGIWQIISMGSKGSIPTPLATGIQAVELFSKTF